MQVPVLESVQVDFLLQVRRGDLSPVDSMQRDMLMKIMDTALNLIIEKGYLVKKQVIINGVMT